MYVIHGCCPDKARLTDLIHPPTFAQAAQYHDLGVRERTLTLPVMVALVLSMIWRQIGSVCTLTRLLAEEVRWWLVRSPARSETPRPPTEAA